MRGLGWQVVGLKSGWHTGMVMGGVNKSVHAKRLAQASAVRLELRAAGAGASEPPLADVLHSIIIV